jgi:hypothetical protein
LKTEWVPAMGYMSLKQAKLDIGRYLMGYYNYQRPHTFNLGLPPAIAEEKTSYPAPCHTNQLVIFPELAVVQMA